MGGRETDVFTGRSRSVPAVTAMGTAADVPLTPAAGPGAGADPDGRVGAEVDPGGRAVCSVPAARLMRHVTDVPFARSSRGCGRARV